jgi:hypothetical protein
MEQKTMQLDNLKDRLLNGIKSKGSSGITSFLDKIKNFWKTNMGRY